MEIAKKAIGILSYSEDLQEITNWLMEEICTGLRICLQVTYLKFRNKFFRQIHSTAMGSPVSVVVTNLVMEDVEERAIDSFGQPPRVWKRFVDDTFVILYKVAVDKIFYSFKSNSVLHQMHNGKQEGQLHLFFEYFYHTGPYRNTRCKYLPKAHTQRTLSKFQIRTPFRTQIRCC